MAASVCWPLTNLRSYLIQMPALVVRRVLQLGGLFGGGTKDVHSRIAGAENLRRRRTVRATIKYGSTFDS